MSNRALVDSALAKLEAYSDTQVDSFKLGNNFEDELKTLEILGDAPPPPAILEFYRDINGVELLWQGKFEDKTIEGSLNILSVLMSGMRAPLEEDGARLEGILWTDDTPESEKSMLENMTIFESVAGRDDFITYDSRDAGVAFFVSDWDVTEIKAPLGKTIELLLRYAGFSDLRDHLLHDDWEQRISEDAAMNAIFG